MMNREWIDTVSAYKLHDSDCGVMLVAEGLVDRDLGGAGSDSAMSAFINRFLSGPGPNPHCEFNLLGASAGCLCTDKDCTNLKDLADHVDVDNWLKNLAVYSVTGGQDSPLGNGNNYFLASTGDAKGWKMVQVREHMR
jgi:hypothetical protein